MSDDDEITVRAIESIAPGSNYFGEVHLYIYDGKDWVMKDEEYTKDYLRRMKEKHLERIKNYNERLEHCEKYDFPAIIKEQK